MNLYEFQAKAILKERGIPVPPGGVARTDQEAGALASQLGGKAWAVKAQIHAGGRGRHGGVVIVDSAAKVKTAAANMLGKHLVTEQTSKAGSKVSSVYVEQAVDVAREIYLAALVDRGAGRVAIMASSEGGADIEEKAVQAPETVLKFTIDPVAGIAAADLDGLVAGLGLEGAQAEAAVDLIAKIYRAFIDNDASLIEINPLAVTQSGDLVALDVKMILDDNALFRHPELEALYDEAEADPDELEAQRFELNYIKMDGDIGIMVSGAGLALAVFDMVTERGGKPADFMDVRPVATREKIAAGIKILLANPKVKAILVVAMGGGILRCDTIAEGVAQASRETGSKIPLIVRFAGTAKELGELCLNNQGIAVTYAQDLEDAADKAIQAAGRGA